MNRIRFSSLLAGLILAALFFSGFGERQARAVGEKTAGTGSAPTCSQFKLYAPTSLTISGKPRIRFWIKNTSAQGTFVQRIVFNWNTYRAINPSQVLRRWRYDDLTNPFDFNIRYSPYSWSKLPGVTGFNTDLLSGEADAFLFDFLNYDSGWPANIPATAFGLKVTLGNGCILAFRPQATATPTKTGTITKTPAISHTPTATPTPTRTQTTKTPTNTITPTRTPLISSTPTLTPTITKTRTITPTYIPTITSTPTPRCIDC